MGRSKLDPSHIQQIIFDEELEAIQVSVMPHELSIELNANDGDSVLTQKDMQVLEVKADDQIDTSKVSRICVTKQTRLSMIVLDQEIDLGPIVPGEVKQICSPIIKIKDDCIVILQS